MKKFVGYIVILILIIFMFAGCSGIDGASVSVVIAGGHHANTESFKIPELSFTHVEDDEKDETSYFLSDNYKIIDVYPIVIDGDPRSADSENINNIRLDIEESANNKRWDSICEFVGDLNTELSKVAADDEEVDTLKTFCVAAEHFNTLDDNVEKRMIIYDTGLSTTGIIDFAHNNEWNDLIKRQEALTDEEIQILVDKLSEQKEIPDLTGVMIYWYGLGLVGEDQQELSKMAKNNLKNIWTAVLEKSGATEVVFKSVDIIKSDDNEDESLPFVSTIEFPNVQDQISSELNSTEKICERLSESKLGFEPESAEFLEGTEEERHNVLSAFVEFGKTEKLLLVGTTSSGGGIGNGLDLSIKRARAVKEELVLLGVPEENIEAIGLGTEHHKYNSDEYIDGVYYGESDAAQENRSVYIMQINCDEAEKFLEEYDKIYN